MKMELKDIKCAMCEKESEQTILISNTVLGEPDLDLRPAGSMASPAAKIQECPYCHYSSFDITDFIEERFKKTLNPLELWNTDEQIQSIIDNEPEDDARKLRLVAQQYYNILDYVNAQKYLIQAFWASSLKDHKNQYLQDALSIYEYTELENDIKKYIQLSDLNRQYGDLKSAKNLLDTAKALYKVLPEDTSAESYSFFEKCFEFEEYLINQKDSNPHNLSEY